MAVLAMGGQGGGVLMDWVVALAESEGWIAQATSVPGVAQRTGATVYYVEMIKRRTDGRYPVLSLMPSPGHVDIVVGAELMEAGRAIQRGFVTPERTTLITSSHRSFAVEEKTGLGDSIADSGKVFQAAGSAAKRFLAFDMAALAEQTGSAISAVLFGALAGSGVLPFSRQTYEATIRASGVSPERSLRGFSAGYDAATAAGNKRTVVAPADPKRIETLDPIGHADFDALLEDARNRFPTGAHAMLAAGLIRVVDYQDIAYGREYLSLVADFLPLERNSDAELVKNAAKYIAVAMAYDDVIRVADLKTRAKRFERVRNEVGPSPDAIVNTVEFMHPRIQEVVGTLPARFGLWMERRPRLMAALDRFVNKGRRVRTTTVRWFMLLYMLGGLRRFRRSMLRHRQEVAHRDAWLRAARAATQSDYALGVEILKLRRLVKGYSDTHARGLSKFDRALNAAISVQGRSDAAEWVRRLHRSALMDEEGVALDGTIKTIESFAKEVPVRASAP
jgi:indolepyruvate ferredoxin oxidoreductase beta subunit